MIIHRHNNPERRHIIQKRTAGKACISVIIKVQKKFVGCFFIIAIFCFAATGSASSASVSPPSAPGEVSILAYNVLYNAVKSDESISLIDQANPDLVCLRELTPGFVKKFETRLGKKYPYRVFYPMKGTWGVGIAGRYPISHAQRFEEKPHRIPALEAIVTIGAQKIKIACLHLFPPVGKHKKSDGFFDLHGMTALMYAVCARHDDIAEVLLEHGADANAVNKKGETALMQAVLSGDIYDDAWWGIVEILLKRGAKVDQRNYKGETALMQAVMKGDSDLVEILLKHGADANIKDKKGVSAMLIAKKYIENDKYEYEKIIKLLNEFGAQTRF